MIARDVDVTKTQLLARGLQDHVVDSCSLVDERYWDEVALVVVPTSAKGQEGKGCAGDRLKIAKA